jgi:hypothetical protein
MHPNRNETSLTGGTNVFALLAASLVAVTPRAAAAQTTPPPRLTLGGAARLAAAQSASAVTARNRAYQSAARSIQGPGGALAVAHDRNLDRRR